MRKEELLEAAVVLFKEKGFHAVSVEEITTSIGISKGGFYRYFKTKESLILELLDRFYQDMIAKSEDFSKELQGNSLLILKKKITIELEQVIDYHYFFQAVMNEFSPTDESAIPTSLNRIFEMLSEWHKKAIMETFGKKLPFINDLVMVLEGAIHSYLGKIVWEQIDFPLESIADFIVESLQAIVHHEASISPVLPPLHEEKDIPTLRNEIIACLNTIPSDMQNINGNHKQIIEFLIEELSQSHPRDFLVDALFTQLSQDYELKRKLTPAITAWGVWKEYDK